MLQNKLHVFQIFQCLGEAVMEKTAGFSHFLLPSPPSLSFSGLNSVQLSRGCIEPHKKTHTHQKKWRHVKCLEVTAILPFEIIFFWGQSFTKQKAFNFTLRHLCHHLKLKVNPVWTQQVNVNRLVSLANGYYCAQFYHNSTFKQAMYIRYWIGLSCKHQKQYGKVSTPVWYVTLHFRDRLGTASLWYRNRAEITVLMCKQKPYPVWLSFRHD